MVVVLGILRGMVLGIPLGGEALQVGHETQPQRVLQVQPFDSHQVASYFGRALSEADTVVIHSKLSRVEVASAVIAYNRKKKQLLVNID